MFAKCKSYIFSDVHFGSSHNFNPVHSPDGDLLDDDQELSFSDLFLKDLGFGVKECPTLLAFTGDISTKCETDGFNQGGRFFETLKERPVCKRQRDVREFAMVPGNHDVEQFGQQNGIKVVRVVQVRECGIGEIDKS